MENELMNHVDIKDHVIDQLHELAEIGDYFSASILYEEFKELLNQS